MSTDLTFSNQKPKLSWLDLVIYFEQSILAKIIKSKPDVDTDNCSHAEAKSSHKH